MSSFEQLTLRFPRFTVRMSRSICGRCVEGLAMRLSQPVDGPVAASNFHSKRRIVRCATSADHRHEVGTTPP